MLCMRPKRSRCSLSWSASKLLFPSDVSLASSSRPPNAASRTPESSLDTKRIIRRRTLAVQIPSNRNGFHWADSESGSVLSCHSKHMSVTSMLARHLANLLRPDQLYYLWNLALSELNASLSPAYPLARRNAATPGLLFLIKAEHEVRTLPNRQLTKHLSVVASKQEEKILTG
jgi:hypothetical protein